MESFFFFFFNYYILSMIFLFKGPNDFFLSNECFLKVKNLIWFLLLFDTIIKKPLDYNKKTYSITIITIVVFIILGYTLLLLSLMQCLFSHKMHSSK